jgi:hypothetical protein
LPAVKKAKCENILLLSLVRNVQVYMEKDDGSISPYTGGGTVQIYNWTGEEVYIDANAGTVAGGKLTLKLPATVPDESIWNPSI